MTNYRAFARTVLSTDEAVEYMRPTAL